MNDQSKFSRENWRATYYAERNAFVVEQAGWIDADPALEYVFCALESETGCMAALEKCWTTDDGGVIGEPFVFAEYETHTEFEADVDHILAEAEQRAQSEGMDHFSAVIDAVKVRAFDAGYVDEEIFDCPGLFDDGPEDAYSWQDDYLDDDIRAEIAELFDQCWRLHAVRVVDLNRKPLGWAVVVLRYPDLSARATEAEVQAATSVELLELDHWPDEFTARFVTQLFEVYMTFGVRFEDPELAELTDYAIFELLSIQFTHENVMDPVWETVEPELINAIYQGEGELMRDPARWYPKQVNLIQQFAEQMGLPTHVVDQFEAFLRDNMQITDEFDANSLWRYLDGEA